MMAALMLFGLSLRPIFDAIAQVESERGATSANVYQIRPIYVDDVNRILHTYRFSYEDRFSKRKSEEMMRIYWAHWGSAYEKETNMKVTYSILAKMHNRGGCFWKKSKGTITFADNYWKKVLKAMNAGKK